MSVITVLGAGTWGIALARLVANNGHSVRVWSKIPEELEVLEKTATHPKLEGIVLPDSISYFADIGKALCGCDIAVMAVPSVFVRSVSAEAAPFIDGQIVVDVAKGIEKDSCKTMSQIIAEVIPSARVVVLSGPTHAEEVAVDMPTAIVSSSHDEEAAKEVQRVFSSHFFRVYTNDDVLGVEICGALKNIIALATGVCTGLGCGDNARAAIITRGIAEIVRLGEKLGCRLSTFAGLAGIGDLVVTATSMHSRNNRAGILLGQGYSAKEAVEKVGMVVEGINALPAAITLAKKHGVDMPIVFTLDAIIKGTITSDDAVNILMERRLKEE